MAAAPTRSGFEGLGRDSRVFHGWRRVEGAIRLCSTRLETGRARVKSEPNLQLLQDPHLEPAVVVSPPAWPFAVVFLWARAGTVF